MTELERLKERLGGRFKNFRVTWGPEAHKLTQEERAAQLNKFFDAIEAGDCENIDDIDEDLPEAPSEGEQKS